MSLTRRDKVLMVLAEAGYPNAFDRESGTDPNDSQLLFRNVPAVALWIAGEMVAPEAMPCWSCFHPNWQGAHPRGICECERCRCPKGDCSHPDQPRRPPRELLRREGAA